MPQLGRRALVAFAAVAALLAPATAAQAASQPATNVNADAEKSVLDLTITWTGSIYYESEGGMRWTNGPVEVHMGCSGFFVSPNGHIATAGHCVDPADGKEDLISKFLDDQVAAGLITDAEADAIWPRAKANWKVEGTNQGSPPARSVKVVQPKRVEGTVITSPMTVQVVDFRPFEGGDVALLKAEVSNSRPLPLATTDPIAGASLTAVGFPVSVSGAVDQENLRATFASGTVSSQQTIEGAARTQMNADLAGGMSGGPSIDALGNGLGVNSSSVVGGKNFNFITDTTDFNEWVRSHGITPAAPLAPQATEAGPSGQNAAVPVSRPTAEGESGDSIPSWVWIVVAITIFILVALVVFLLTRRARKSAPPNQAQPQQQWHQPTAPYQAPADNACSSCGTSNTPGARFCSNCGGTLSSSQAAGGFPQ